jgi:glycine cleavage system H lipoate-binding protein
LNIFQEYAKLDDEMKDVPQGKREERLREKVVVSRLEKVEKLAEKDKELGKIESQKVIHNFHLFCQTTL